MKLSVIILSWNTKNLLGQCLKSLQTNLDFDVKTEIIVVDNASEDGSVAMTKKEFPQVKVIENKDNFGYARGNNVGLGAAKGEYVMILNSDTIIKKGAIETLVNFLDKNKKVAVVGPKLLNSDGSAQASCGRFPGLVVAAVMLFKEHFGGSNLVRYSPDKSGLVDWLMGSAFVARRAVFEKIGGFDEKLFMYMEEVEWFFRARKSNFEAYFLKEAEIIHLGRGSSRSGKKEPILNIYKGLIHYYEKHRSLGELLILKIMLKLKAGMAYLWGNLKKDDYLINTYGEAFKIS